MVRPQGLYPPAVFLWVRNCDGMRLKPAGNLMTALSATVKSTDTIKRSAVLSMRREKVFLISLFI
jgi:hypothetical protein